MENLRDKLWKHLVASGNFDEVIMDTFEDESASWISCHRISKDDPDVRITQELSFNGAGTVLENVETWKEVKTWDGNSIKIEG